MHEWNDTGYDLLRTDRWLYAFATADQRFVKVGMVLVEARLTRRLSEVRRMSGRTDLTEVWRGRLPGTTHEEAEHIESVVRHWLTGAAGFKYIGEVDWLEPPPHFDSTTWSAVLDEAVRESTRFGR